MSRISEHSSPWKPPPLYQMVFGSENFEDFVGELQLASLVSMVEGDEPSMKGLAHKQRKREVGHHSPIAP